MCTGQSAGRRTTAARCVQELGSISYQSIRQVCSDSDTGVHKVCCDPDQKRRFVDDRKVKIGGKDKREAANARVDTFLENIVPTKIPELNKKREKIGIKMKRGVKAQEQRRIDQVD